MTAAEWRRGDWNIEAWPKVLADLAACEAERDELKHGGYYALRQDMERMTADRDDLLAAHPAGPDLREACEKFVREYVVCPDDPAVVCPVLEDARMEIRAALTAHTEAGEWRGPVRCNKCSKVYATAPSAHYWSWNKHPYPRELCDGTFIPYERRASTRPAEQQEVADLRRKLTRTEEMRAELRERLTAVVTERDDLRRKLGEAERENYRAVWIEAAKQRDDMAAKLADTKAEVREGKRKAFVDGSKYTPLSGREELWIDQIKAEALRRYGG